MAKLSEIMQPITSFNVTARLKPLTPKILRRTSPLKQAQAAYAEGNLRAALQMYLRLAEHDPANASLQNDIGVIAGQLEQYQIAIAAHRKAVKLDAAYTSYATNYATTLARYKASVYDSELARDMLLLITHPAVEAQRLSDAAIALLKQQPDMEALLSLPAHPASYRAQVFEGKLGSVTQDPLFLELLKSVVMTDAAMEVLLCGLRKTLLLAFINGQHEALQSQFALLAGLAQQALLNDFVWYADTVEQQHHQDILQRLVSGALMPSPLLLAVLACYQSLIKLPYATGLPAIFEKEDNLALQAILTRHIKEPAAEEAIKRTIPQLSQIDNATSQQVQQHYEAHPYPRWQTVAPIQPVASVGELVKYGCPTADISPKIGQHRAAVLIAGCGTGRHAMIVRQLLPKASIMAVDLSLKSLAYGRKKADEQQLGHAIDFVQGDILTLPSTGRKFDFIDCVGVLHHLAEPEDGLQALLAMLLPKGVMRLGLYATSGREDVLEAQRYSRFNELTDSEADIRTFRHMVLTNDDMAEGIKRLSLRRDFYTLSECRDMVFHRFEKNYTLIELDDVLQRYGLRFLGFDRLPLSVRAHYAKRFPMNPAMDNLLHWHQLERDMGGIFGTMYQFWVAVKS